LLYFYLTFKCALKISVTVTLLYVTLILIWTFLNFEDRGC
jgi:hypothetical protein